MMDRGHIRATLLAAVSAAAILPTTALAQAAPAADEQQGLPQEAVADDIVVTGIRASQARSIEVKRNADSVVEAISAQDIGKLPDVTISDSLQRIAGVQIRREAGEGGAINIRGLPQVTTLMNGEQFLGANSVTTVQPNFTDIPSQLFSGATVFKSPTASLQQAGLSGTVDLLTRRPFDLKNGLTVAGAVEAQYGDKTKKWNPSANGLIAYNSGRVGILVSAAYSDLDLSNSYRGIQDYGVALRNEGGSATNSGDFAVGNNGVSRGTPVRNGAGQIVGFDVNGDGDANDAFITPQSHTAWNKITSRKRFGANASLQFEINDALKLTADGFYTKQTQYDRTAGFQFQMVDWQSSPYLPTSSRNTGAVVGGFDLNTVQTYAYDLANFDSYAETFRTKSESQNYNLQLDWDNSSTLKATVRGIYGKASRKSDQGYLQFSLTDGSQWGYQGTGNYPASLGGDVRFNPTGYPVYSQKATVDYSSGAPVFTFPQAFLAQAADVSRYGLKTISSENNVYQDGDLWAFRGDLEWKPSDQLSIKAGGRYGERSVEQFTFERVSPFYAGNTDNSANPSAGCLVKWKAFDVNLNDPKCSVRDAQGVAYTAGYTRQANDPVFAGLIKQFNLPAAGTPPLFVLDPKALDNSEAFQNQFYPGSRNNVNPADSFGINLRQISGYVQVNGEGEIGGMPIKANGGVRIVNTKFSVRQNVVGAPQPYGVSGVDAGDVVVDRDFTDFLPAFNASLDVTDKLRVRASFAKTMTLLDFLQWGGGLNVNYAINTTGTGTPIFAATGASARGNPQLDPWRADNVEASVEYYTGQSSLIAVGAYYLSVEKFIENATVIRNDIPDNDGVIRRPVPVNTIVQGEGGSLKGVEASARQALADYGVNGFFGGFGIDANYTLSLGDTGRTDLSGADQPFGDNSKHQANAALWYEQYGLQARVAYNYRSKRLVSSDYAGITGLAQYQRPTNYLDASIAFDVTPNITIYGQASNLTAETERYYLTFQDQVAWENIYERRFIAGVRAKF
ncbi:TonB-dependent receptor [Sphingomonas sp. SUN019]|uniref:TonB-dependent receptor n=1 Tax=Sphingomonas sp. SUN019 TaxID=2937788 RepID=UPI00216449BB|nr:TonB-dependent receptor [Sphingomonas sp. SUN019]UVO50557.1 TonB-dependent receptor [Sphingomonas sp. SUN019]